MNDKLFLIPKRGLQVRDPATGQPMPSDGTEVEMSSYWQRRLDDGDVHEPRSIAAQFTSTADGKTAASTKTKE